ncbi:hypothetical protein SAMN05421721_1259 [Ectothiorhodospira mobilis]|uniref:Uncharacterized protein n=1 Tax=Ectothiorhodospira mobilis TaxID=195064 RepID=A0A1I4SYT5_ECTMO|nr:hypothetical protein [Ectothiorhodospira mobilis]SFM69678.1 hypothetical protein SAMN05421721_1259 [Ectothiorhodospira mobilis]
MIEVQIDGAELTAALERLARSGAELRPVLQEAGELLVHTTRPVPRARGAESSAKDLLAIPGPRVGGLEGSSMAYSF